MKRPTRKNLIRFVGIPLLLSLLLIILLGATVACLLGTQGGRLWLLDKGLAVGLGDGPLQVSVENVRTPSLGNWSVDRLLVTRQQETWLDIRDLHLQWRPRALLQKRLLVTSVGARQVDLDPTAGAQTKEPAESDAGGGLSLPSMAIQNLELDRFRLTGGSTQIPDLHIAGNLRALHSLPLLLNLRIDTLPKGPTAPAHLTIESQSESHNRISVRGSVTEEPGGWLSQQLKLPAEIGIDAGFAAIVGRQPRGYRLSLHRLELPFLAHHLNASGEVFADPHLRTLAINELQLSTDDRQHRLTGSLSREGVDLGLDLQLTLNRFPLDLLSPWIRQLDDGWVSAQIHAGGTLDNPLLSGRMSGTSQYKGQMLNLDLAGDFSRRQLSFRQLSAGFGITKLRAEGRLDLEGANSQLSFALQNFPNDYLNLLEVPVPALPSQLKFRILNADGQLTGDYRDPRVRLQASAKGSFRQGNEHRTFTARVDAKGSRQRLSFGSAVIQIAGAQAEANGVIDLQGDESDLGLRLNEVPLSLLELAQVDLPSDFDANLSGTARLTGSLKKPRGSGKLLAKGQFRGAPFKLELEANGSRQQIQLRHAQASVGDALLTANGIIDPMGRATDLSLELDQTPLSLLELAGIELPNGLTADISGSATLTGALPLPQVDSEMHLDGVYKELPFALTANGSFIEKRLQVDKLQLDLDDTTALEVSGFLQPDAYDLQLTVNDLPRHTVSQLGWNLVTGDFNGKLHVQGTPTEPSIEGHFFYGGQLTGLDLASGEETTFDLGWETDITTKNRVLSVISSFSRNRQDTGGFRLTLPISDYLSYIDKGGTPADMPLAFSLDGAVDLAILSLLLDPDIHRISGRAAVRVDAGGSLARPRVTGVLELLNSRYENTLSGTLFTDIQLLLKSSGTRLNIVEAIARGRGQGTVKARGQIDWAQPHSETAVDIVVTADDAALLQRDDIDGEVSGEITLAGSFDELWLKGNLDVAPFAANIEVALQSQIPEIEVIEIYGDSDEIESDTGQASSLMPTIRLDLTIEADQQAYLRGRGLEAELAGQIDLTGSVNEPHFDGEFSVLRGVFEVFGHKFELLQGEVIFANNALYLFIPGQLIMDEYTIRAELSGTVETLSLSLTSVPDLPEDEILSRLIFGKSAQNITAFQAIRLAGAIQTLRGGGGGFDPIGSTRDALGVDTLSVESASTDAGTGVSVGVGKYINERVYLEVKRTPDEIRPWQGSIEIELTPRLHLKSTTGGDGSAGAELLWKRDF